MKDMNDVADILRGESDKWFKEMCANPWAEYYLYHRPTTEEEPGAIIITEENTVPPNFELSGLGRLHGEYTKGQVYKMAMDLSRRLPILEY